MILQESALSQIAFNTWVTLTERRFKKVHTPLATELELVNIAYKDKIYPRFVSQRLAIVKPGFTYWEGRVIDPKTGQYRPWGFNMSKANEVFDITARKNNIAISEWIGIQIPNDVVLEYWKSRSKNHGIIEYYYNRYVYGK